MSLQNVIKRILFIDDRPVVLQPLEPFVHGDAAPRDDVAPAR